MEKNVLEAVNITDKYVAFWGGVFSNFYPCEIRVDTDKGEIVFKSSEQYFMWQKAMFFKDEEIAEQILKADSPAEAKKLGRKVRNYDDAAWSKNRADAMYKAVLLKFKQNKALKDIILADEFKDKGFVEGSPYDKIWGVGISWDNPKIADRKNWKGENLLGKVLNWARHYLSCTTVGELIEKLKEFPEDMPVGLEWDLSWPIEIEKRTWTDTNYPFDDPDIEFVNIG